MNLSNILKPVLNIFGNNKKSASIAKDRLQFVISQERALRKGPEYLPQMQQDLIDIIAKYIEIDKESINVEINHIDGKMELNIVLADQADQAEQLATA